MEWAAQAARREARPRSQAALLGLALVLGLAGGFVLRPVVWALAPDAFARSYPGPRGAGRPNAVRPGPGAQAGAGRKVGAAAKKKRAKKPAAPKPKPEPKPRPRPGPKPGSEGKRGPAPATTRPAPERKAQRAAAAKAVLDRLSAPAAPAAVKRVFIDKDHLEGRAGKVPSIDFGEVPAGDEADWAAAYDPGAAAVAADVPARVAPAPRRAGGAGGLQVMQGTAQNAVGAATVSSVPVGTMQAFFAREDWALKELCSEACEAAPPGGGLAGALGRAQCADLTGPTSPGRKRDPVACDLGTQCKACGPRRAYSDGRHVAALRAQGVDVFLRPVRLLEGLEFLMPHTDPKKDVDVSLALATTGNLEPRITDIMQKAFVATGCCEAGGYFLDVGANFGFFSLLAAKAGCRVVAWEPVPRFAAFLEYGVQLNRLEPLVHVRQRVVGKTREGELADVVVPNRGIWGVAGVNGMNLDPEVKNDGALEVVRVPVEAVDSVVPPETPVCMLKVDVEGFEPEVFRSAANLFRRGSVQNVVFEYSPGIYERQGNWAGMPEFPEILKMLHEHGFELANVEAYQEPETHLKRLEDAMHPFEAITEKTIRHDLDDAYRMRKRNAGLEKGLPEGLHPKSLHSVFSHNTNVWASLPATGLMRRGRAVGVLDEDQDENDPDARTAGKWGMGGRVCAHLPKEPAFIRKHHRCPDDA